MGPKVTLDFSSHVLTVDTMDRANLISEEGQKELISKTFHIFSQDNYRLWFGTYSGNAGDALSGGSNFEDQWSASHRGMQFTTSDKDHDRFLAGNCALENKGGWWFNRYRKQLVPLGRIGSGWLRSREGLPASEQLDVAVCVCHLAQPNLRCPHLQILQGKQSAAFVMKQSR